MLNRIKYRLLIYLLNDICERSECDICDFDMSSVTPYSCHQNRVFVQARKVWGLNHDR